MTDSSKAQGVEVNRALLTGGIILISAGALMGALGAAATMIAAIGAGRSWVRQLDEPPSVTARRRLAQARAAAAAGAVAGAQGWREHGGPAQANSAMSPGPSHPAVSDS